MLHILLDKKSYCYLIFALYYFFNHLKSFTTKTNIILGMIIGLSIGVHPNSFILSLPFILIYLYNVFIVKKLKLKDFLVFGITLSIFAAFFVSFSLYLDPNFFHNYLKYGKQFGVLYPASSKLSQIKYFYSKLYHGVSGTYYTPNIKFQFFLFTFSSLVALVRLYIMKKNILKDKIICIILSIVAINIGTVIVGRYNQTSIIFQFPLFYILVVFMFYDMTPIYRRVVSSFIIITLIGFSVFNISPYIHNDYNDYISEISKIVRKDQRVLSNLNSDFYFDNDKSLDYRNLTFLKDNNITFEEYIYNNDIITMISNI